MSKRTFSGSRDGEAAGRRAPRTRTALRAAVPDGDPAAARKPVKSIGRFTGRLYDPVTGRKLPPEARR